MPPGTAGDEGQLRLFVRQPLTQTNARELSVLAGVFEVLRDVGAGHAIELLGGTTTEAYESSRAEFTRRTGLPFTTEAFRRSRLDQLRRADGMIVITTGLSERGAFEIAYNIFGGRRVPMFMAVWDQAPIETTLLQNLSDLCRTTSVTFADPRELRAPLMEFVRTCRASFIAETTSLPHGPVRFMV